MYDFWTLLFGAFLATAGGFCGVRTICSQERRSRKAAIAAEIRAILSIVERRDYIAGMQRFINTITAEQTC